MTDATPTVSRPIRRTGGSTYRLRQLQLVLALLFVAMIGLQVFFAGLGVLVSPSYFAWHVSLGHFFSLPIIGLLLLGLLGRSGWRSVGLTVALFFLYGLQYAFIEGTSGPVRALHVLNALLLFWLALGLVRLSWQNVRAAAPVGKAGGRSFGRLLAGGVMVVLGAVILFGAFLDDGPGLPLAFPDSSENPTEPEAEPAKAATPSVLAVSGKDLYAQRCASCHGAAGEGGFGPALAENTELEDEAQTIEQVLGGGGGMPAFGQLSDEEVAAVVSYVRSSWGNSFPSVMPAKVAAQR